MVETQTPSDPEVDTLKPDVDPAVDPNKIIDDANNNPNIDVNAGDPDPADPEADPDPKNWYDGLDPDYRNDPNVTKYDSMAEFVKGSREMSKMLGKDKLVVPTDKSSKEEVDAFYNKLGRPEEAGSYVVPALTEIPEEIRPRAEVIEAYKQKAHELGLTDKQFTSLMEMENEMNLSQFNTESQRYQGMKDASETALRKEYGDAYETKVDNAQKVINTFFAGQKMDKAFGVLSNDTGFIRAMANIADKLGEDVIQGEPRNTLTPTEAQKEIDSLMAGTHDLSKALFDELDPEHQEAVNKNIALQTMAQAGAK